MQEKPDYIKCEYTELVSVQDIKPRENNPNKHNEAQINTLASLLMYQGIRKPLIISKLDGLLVTGHGTLEAIIKNGWGLVPVSYQDFESQEQAYAHCVADNAIARQSELDFSMINLELQNLGPDINIDLLGIKDFVLEPIEKLEPGCDEDNVPEVKETICKPGDLFILGNHRLLCGDSTNIHHVERLMNNEKADMCFTSPPYNLGNNAKLRGFNGDWKDSAYNQKSDHKTEQEYLDFLIAATNCALIGAHTVFWNIQLLAGNKFVLPIYWNAFKNNLVDLFCWDKEYAQPSAAHRVLNSVWEFIFIFSNEQFPTRSMKFGHDFRGTIDNIYRLNPVGKKDPLAKGHGAVFPVQFAEFFVSNFSDKTILDLFGGSGSTLIACEKTHRKCFMMEIDPHYCDVIINRWEKYSNKKAYHENGLSYQELKEYNGQSR